MSTRTTIPRDRGNSADESTIHPVTPGAPFGAVGGPADDDASGTVEEVTWSMPQVASVMAGAGAAATSTLVGGHLGVAGTVIGAAVASIVTTLAINVYDNTLRRAAHRLRLAVARIRHPEKVAGTPVPSTPAPPRKQLRPSPRVLRWAAITAVLGTVIGLGLMVGIERNTTEPITPGTSRLAEAAPGSGVGGARDSARTVPGSDTQGATTEPDAAAPSAATTPAAPDTVASDTPAETSDSESGTAPDAATDPGTLADAPAGSGSGATGDTDSGGTGAGTASSGDTVTP